MNKELIIVFNDIMTINRMVHLTKITNILHLFFNKISIFISSIDYNVFQKQKIEKGNKNKTTFFKHILVLNARKPVISSHDRKRIQIFSEWVLHTVQIMRLIISKKFKTKEILLMGTLNLPLIIILRIILGAQVYLFAGGFAYMQHIISSGNSLYERMIIVFKRCLTMLIEFLSILLTNYIIVESKGVCNYLPVPRFLKSLIIRRKTYVYGSLYVDKELFRYMTPLNKREYVFGYIGRWEHHRATIELIYAFKQLARIIPKSKFILIGAGPLKEKIFKIVKNDPILREHILLKDEIGYEEVPKYMNKIKFLVLPSRQEGLPNTVIEAMACGCIVVASPVGGITDVIKDYKTGFILSSLEPYHIAKTLLKLLSLDKELLEKISRNAIMYVNSRFDLGIVRRYWQEIFNINNQYLLRCKM